MGDGGAIDQVLVDRIGKQIEKLLEDLPGCETWKGTFSGTYPPGSADICTSQLEGTITLVVAKGGRVNGQAQWTYPSHSGPDEQCNQPITGTFTYPVLGRATRDAFEISPPFASVGQLRIPKSGNRARRDSFVDAVGGSFSVELRCVSC